MSGTGQGPKFKMSDGKTGAFRGQAPRDEFEAAGLGKRSYRTDTEHEQMAVKPMHTSKDHESTGFTSQMAGLATDGVMEQAIQDKLTQTMKEGVEDGWNARLEEERNRPQDVTAAEIDEMADNKNADDNDLEALRNKRRQQMKEAQEKKLKYQALGHGEFTEIEEEAFLKTVTASERCVVHFYHKNFEKCKVMDMHLRKCAKKFMGTRFVKLDAEKSPFFVEKLQIKTLPCAVVFNDGVAKGKQTGFEGLSQSDDFSTVQLAWKFKEWTGIEEDFGPDDELEFPS